MRIFFLLIVLVNLALYGVGQGWMGRLPSDAGRGPVAPPELAPQRIVPEAPAKDGITMTPASR